MTTKYQKIFTTLKNQIDQGILKTGDRLPSVRQLASQYACSKDTVQRALLELSYKNYIYAKPQSGYYVLEEETGKHTDLPLRLKEDRFQAFEDFRTCINETLVGRDNYLFNYYEKQEGLVDLRQSIASLLREDAIYTQEQQIVITSGTQQALYLLSQVAFPNQKEEILVEQPTYYRINKLIQEQDLPYQSINRLPQGIDFDQLEAIFKSGRIKFFYTIPRYHYPLGHSYSKQEKEQILALAELYDVYIVEDDYLGDYEPHFSPSFHYLDANDRVIYIKSFSTSLFSALRITSMVLPQALLAPVLKLKGTLDYESNLVMQKALSLYIDNGMFAKNKDLLHQQQAVQTEQATSLLYQYSLPIPAWPVIGGVLLDLRQVPSVARLKHSGLPLHFFESDYIQSCPYAFARINQDKLEEVLPQIIAYL